MGKPRYRERTATIPATTVLKLFCYPGKDGMLSSYPTTYCVGFEMRNKRQEDGAEFVSQHFLTAWSEDLAQQTKNFEWIVQRFHATELKGK